MANLEVLIYLSAFFVIGCLGNGSRQKRSSVCFSHVGCFSNDAPFTNTQQELPQNPNFIQTTFYHYTVNKRFPTKLVTGDVDRLNRSRYNASLPTKFIVHGFIQHGRVRWIKRMAREFIRKTPMNVIAVDWGRGSGFPYTQAVANTRVVGAEIANLVGYLTRQAGANVQDFHIIGHSLGAHIAGYAGDRITDLYRITGLDPAGPNFQGTDPRVRLDPTDASIVDAIHTDGSEYETISGYGTTDAVGDLDFYPNGGINQPGCPRESWSNVIEESYTDGIFGTANDIGCSHSRSIRLFTESINSRCQFKAFPCADRNQFNSDRCFDCGEHPCPSMGYDADRYEARGKFYLKTDSRSPYCRYMYNVKMAFRRDMQPQRGSLTYRILGTSGLSAPFTVHSGERSFTPNQIQNATFMSVRGLGNIVQVQVVYRQPHSFLSSLWSTPNSIAIKMISVFSANTNTTLYFCGHGGNTVSGYVEGFNNATTDPNNCTPHQVRQI